MESDDGPRFRLWPPVSIGVPLVLGLLVSWLADDPLGTSQVATWVGWLLLAAFAISDACPGCRGNPRLRDTGPT